MNIDGLRALQMCAPTCLVGAADADDLWSTALSLTLLTLRFADRNEALDAIAKVPASCDHPLTLQAKAWLHKTVPDLCDELINLAAEYFRR